MVVSLLEDEKSIDSVCNNYWTNCQFQVGCNKSDEVTVGGSFGGTCSLSHSHLLLHHTQMFTGPSSCGCNILHLVRCR